MSSSNGPLARKYFCPLPWVHLSSRPNGDYRLCCRVQKQKIWHEERAAKWGRTDIQDIWNGDYYQDIRTRLLKDEPLSECQYCYQDEANGLDSLRLKKINIFAEQSRQILRDQSVTAPLPIEVDLKFGNQCNLSCMMCWPTSSSKVAGEIQKMVDMGFRDERFGSDLQTALNMDSRWGESDMFEENFRKLIPGLQSISATGGEPFANRKFRQLLERLVQAGQSKSIILKIITNLTLIDDRLLETLSQFQYVLINVSMDGTGSAYEYIRHPAKWSEWVEKFRQLKACKALTTDICITYSAYSVFNLVETLRWIKAETGSLGAIQMISLFEPTFLDVAQIPPSAKREIRRDFENFMRVEPDARPHLLPVLAQMDSPNDPALIQKCLEYTRLRDQVSGRCIERSIPDFLRHYQAETAQETAL